MAGCGALWRRAVVPLIRRPLQSVERARLSFQYPNTLQYNPRDSRNPSPAVHHPAHCNPLMLQSAGSEYQFLKEPTAGRHRAPQDGTGRHRPARLSGRGVSKINENLCKSMEIHLLAPSCSIWWAPRSIWQPPGSIWKPSCTSDGLWQNLAASWHQLAASGYS